MELIPVLTFSLKTVELCLMPKKAVLCGSFSLLVCFLEEVLKILI